MLVLPILALLAVTIMGWVGSIYLLIQAVRYRGQLEPRVPWIITWRSGWIVFGIAIALLVLSVTDSDVPEFIGALVSYVPPLIWLVARVQYHNRSGIIKPPLDPQIPAYDASVWPPAPEDDRNTDRKSL